MKKLPGHDAQNEPTTTPIDDTTARPRLSVIGTGYLGATHAAAMAELGFQVVGVDTDPHKVAELQEGRVPFFEPGLPELIKRHVASGRLTFTTDIAEATAASDVHFICVGTPQQSGSFAANLSYVEAAARAIASNLTHDAVIVGKSTVPVAPPLACAPSSRRRSPRASRPKWSGTPSSCARARPSATPCTRIAS